MIAENANMIWELYGMLFPHWSAVYYYFKKWKYHGLFEEVLDKLNERERKLHKRKIGPSVGIIDSQSVKVAHTCSQNVGYDAGKKVKGRKRHIVTDTLGCFYWFWYMELMFKTETESN